MATGKTLMTPEDSVSKKDSILIELLPKTELNNTFKSESKVNILSQNSLEPKKKKKCKINIGNAKTSCPECLIGLNLIGLREHISKEHWKDKVYCMHCDFLLDRRDLAIHLI